MEDTGLRIFQARNCVCSTNFLVHCVAENEAKVLSLNSGQDLTQTGPLKISALHAWASDTSE